LSLVKLTNAAEEHRGNSLYLHSNWIVSVFQVSAEFGGSLTTVVYGGPLGTSWNVEESPEEIRELMKDPK
jgi:hypothetical protein